MQYVWDYWLYFLDRGNFEILLMEFMPLGWKLLSFKVMRGAVGKMVVHSRLFVAAATISRMMC